MSKKIAAPYPSNGVYGADGKFYANGSTPPKEAGEFDNPRVYAGGGSDAGEPEQVVGAPTPEQVAADEEAADQQASGDVGASDGDNAPSVAVRKAVAKTATAKKAPAKKSG